MEMTSGTYRKIVCAWDGAGHLLSTPKALNVIKERVQVSLIVKDKMMLINSVLS